MQHTLFKPLSMMHIPTGVGFVLPVNEQGLRDQDSCVATSFEAIEILF